MRNDTTQDNDEAYDIMHSRFTIDITPEMRHYDICQQLSS